MAGMLAALLLWYAVADRGQAEATRKFLASLSPGDPECLCSARDYVQSRLAESKPHERSAEFFALWDFYDHAVLLNQTRIKPMGGALTPEEYDLLVSTLRVADTDKRSAQLRAKSPTVWRLMEPWLRGGYVIAVDFDQTLALDPNPWFLRTLNRVWDSESREYLNLFLNESPYALDHDGALAVPWDRLRSRIVRWERFRAAHLQNSDLVRHIDLQLKTMFRYYLCGLPNSEPFGATGELSSDVRESYDRFLRLNSGSREYTTIESAIKLLRQNSWKVSPHSVVPFQRVLDRPSRGRVQSD